MEDLSHATQKDPWGPASHEALRHALSIASRLGLDAHDCEGYLGYADVAGSSEDYLATIAQRNPCRSQSEIYLQASSP